MTRTLVDGRGFGKRTVQRPHQLLRKSLRVRGSRGPSIRVDMSLPNCNWRAGLGYTVRASGGPKAAVGWTDV